MYNFYKFKKIELVYKTLDMVELVWDEVVFSWIDKSQATDVGFEL